MKHSHRSSTKTKNTVSDKLATNTAVNSSDDPPLDSVDNPCNYQKIIRSYQNQVEQLKQENSELKDQLAASQEGILRSSNQFNDNCNQNDDAYQKYQTNEIACLHKKIIEKIVYHREKKNHRYEEPEFTIDVYFKE